MLTVRLLGGFEVLHHGQRVDISSRPAQALLAYLLLPPGKPHRREHLAGLLWPDAPESSALRNLRQVLWHLGRSLDLAGGRLVAADRFNIWVDVRGLDRLDVAILQAQLPPDAPIEALIDQVAVYQGELLPGFYQDWVVSERRQLEAQFERLITHLLRRLEDEGRWPQALEWGQRWIGLGYAPEAAYQSVMRAHAALGDAAGASLAYQRCREALRKQYDLEPSEQTRALHEQIVRAAGMTEAVPAEPPEPDEPAEPPYKGLHYFSESDAHLFFGREQLVSRLLDWLHEHDIIAVVGASGSGKSSLMRAGLLPALRRMAAHASAAPLAGWQLHILTPGPSPLESLAASLAGAGASGAVVAGLAGSLLHDQLALSGLVASAPGRLLVVDQFEEVFTLCHDEAARRAFIRHLTAVGQPAGGSGAVRVVIVLRADFYAHTAGYAELREVLENHQFLIGAMSTGELRQAIEQPARLAGLAFQSGLVDLILRDVGDEPGALPLLSHALLETWKRRRGRQLVLSGYFEAGSVRGAIAHTAQAVYQGLPPEHQALARRLFLRLTELGAGTGATRRRVALAELMAFAGPVQAVLQALAEARLITLGADSVEVAHEALIREWPTLQQWLADDREGLRLHRHLTEAALAWAALERDPSELYRGGRLEQALEWAQSEPEALNALEQEFLEAATLQAAQEAAEREAQRQRELAAARQLAEVEKQRAEQAAQAARQLRRSTRIQRIMLLAAFILIVVAGVLAIEMRDAAAQARASLARSEAQRLAAEASALLQSGGDAQLIALLAINSAKIQYTPEADAALGRALALNFPSRRLSGHTNSLRDVAYSPDGQHIVTAANDGTARIWHAASGELLHTLAGHEGPVTSVAYSGDGRWILTGGEDSAATLWEAATGKRVRQLLGHAGQVQSVALATDGRWAVTNGVDDTVRVWEVATGQPVGEVLHVASETMALAPDGWHVLTGNRDGLAQIWDWRSGAVVQTLAGHESRLIEVAFSADGRRAVTAGVDKTARVWEVATGAQVAVLEGHAASIFGACFSPDGRLVVTAGEDRTARLWDAESGRELGQFFGHTATVTDLAFAPDGHHFVTAGADGLALVWDVRPPGVPHVMAGHGGQIWGMAFAPDGRHLVTGSVDKTARVWDVQTGETVQILSGHTAEIFGVAYSADSRYVLTAGLDGTARLWNVATGQAVQQFLEPGGLHMAGAGLSPDGRFAATGGDSKTALIWDVETGEIVHRLAGHAAGLNLLAYSPDGAVLATTSTDATARLWDTQSGALRHVLTGHTAFVVAVAFSPDGRHVVTAGADKTARVWDVATGEQLQVIAGHSDSIWGVAYTPDGAHIATASSDGTARLWEAATGAEVRRFVGHTAGLEAVAVAPQGDLLATASDDGTARLWEIDYQATIRALCARLLRDLTDAERAQYGLGPEPTCRD